MAQRVIHAHLVVKIVETAGNVASVFGRIVYLADEEQVGIFLLHLPGDPSPKLGWHHLGHVTTETVDTLGSPEAQDVEHLVPGVGNGVEVAHTSGIVVDTIVELDGLIPVVASRGIVEMVVARGLGRHLLVGPQGTVADAEGG